MTLLKLQDWIRQFGGLLSRVNQRQSDVGVGIIFPEFISVKFSSEDNKTPSAGDEMIPSINNMITSTDEVGG